MTRTLLPIALVALLAPGCMTIYPGTSRLTTLEELKAEPGWTLIEKVPFVPQESEEDCGAACLAMVLRHWGVIVPVAQLEEECSVPGEEGIKASALREAATRRGLAAYVIRGSVEDLRHELERGRPVVVGLLKPSGEGVTAHYEVVVGLHPGDAQVALLDPAAGLLRDSLSGFASEWNPAGAVTIVLFRREGRPLARAGGGD